MSADWLYSSAHLDSVLANGASPLSNEAGLLANEASLLADKASLLTDEASPKGLFSWSLFLFLNLTISPCVFLFKKGEKHRCDARYEPVLSRLT